MREVHGQVMLLAGCGVLRPDLQHALLCAALLPARLCSPGRAGSWLLPSGAAHLAAPCPG